MFVNVTIPVYNEERELAPNVGRLHEFLTKESAYDWELVIANNGSTDATAVVGRELARNLPKVRLVDIETKGRGGAIKMVWLASDADILSYMDVDLSTDLAAFPALIAGLSNGTGDLAIGSRLKNGSQTKRGLKRESISRCYNLLVKALFRTRFSDAQCGFKAITRKACGALLPLVEDSGWFFDTELLVLAEKMGFRVLEIPVHWEDDVDSRVNLVRTAIGDLRGLVRLRRTMQRRVKPEFIRSGNH